MNFQGIKVFLQTQKNKHTQPTASSAIADQFCPWRVVVVVLVAVAIVVAVIVTAHGK